MRLIDADKLKLEIHRAYSDDLEIREKIDNQPTAYDVDKVVEKLEKEARMLYSLGAFEPVSAWETKDILPIVKGGGIDE